MQNLQTKFPPTAPNIEYLGQFQLLDQSQIVQQGYGTDFNFQIENYEFQQQSQTFQGEQRQYDYKTFCQRVLKLNLDKERSFLETLISELTLLVFKEVVQYKFLKYQLRNSQSFKKQKIAFTLSQKLYVFLKLFALFAFLYFYPLQTAILLAYFWKSHENNIQQSQIGCLNLLSRQLNQKFLKIKIDMLQYLSKARKSAILTNHILSQLVSQIQAEFQIKSNCSAVIMDQFQATVFQIVKGIKQRALQAKFVTSSIFQSYINYIRIIKINQSLKCSITMMNQFSQQIKIIIEQERFHTVKFKFDANHSLYFSIFTQKLKAYGLSRSLNGQQIDSFKSKINVLIKQIAFRKLYCFQKKIIKDQNSAKSQQSQIQPESQFTENKNPQKMSVCFQNDSMELYDPGDLSIIKQQLEKIILQKEKKERRQRQEGVKKEKDSLEQCFRLNSKQIKPQRISFGIGLIPPKRNLQAFYTD